METGANDGGNGPLPDWIGEAAGCALYNNARVSVGKTCSERSAAPTSACAMSGFMYVDLDPERLAVRSARRESDDHPGGEYAKDRFEAEYVRDQDQATENQ